jgi:hypothetical protein
MDKNVLAIGKPTAWFIAIINPLIAIYLILSKALSWETCGTDLKSIYFTTILLGIAIFTNDIYLQKVYHKRFWIFSVIILSPVAPLFYMLQRDKLIRLGKKFNR